MYCIITTVMTRVGFCSLLRPTSIRDEKCPESTRILAPLRKYSMIHSFIAIYFCITDPGKVDFLMANSFLSSSWASLAAAIYFLKFVSHVFSK